MLCGSRSAAIPPAGESTNCWMRGVWPPMGKGARNRRERAEKHGQEAGQLADGKVIPQASDGQPPWIPLGQKPPWVRRHGERCAPARVRDHGTRYPHHARNSRRIIRLIHQNVLMTSQATFVVAQRVGHGFGHGTRRNRCEQAGRGETGRTAERRWPAAMRPGAPGGDRDRLDIPGS